MQAPFAPRTRSFSAVVEDEEESLNFHDFVLVVVDIFFGSKFVFCGHGCVLRGSFVGKSEFEESKSLRCESCSSVFPFQRIRSAHDRTAGFSHATTHRSMLQGSIGQSSEIPLILKKPTLGTLSYTSILCVFIFIFVSAVQPDHWVKTAMSGRIKMPASLKKVSKPILLAAEGFVAREWCSSTPPFPALTLMVADILANLFFTVCSFELCWLCSVSHIEDIRSSRYYSYRYSRRKELRTEATKNSPLPTTVQQQQISQSP